MGLLDGHSLAGLTLPIGGEGSIELLVELACGIIRHVEELNRARGRTTCCAAWDATALPTACQRESHPSHCQEQQPPKDLHCVPPIPTFVRSAFAIPRSPASFSHVVRRAMQSSTLPQARDAGGSRGRPGEYLVNSIGWRVYVRPVRESRPASA